MSDKEQPKKQNKKIIHSSNTCPECEAATMRKRIIEYPPGTDAIIWRCPNCNYSEWGDPVRNLPPDDYYIDSE